MISKFKEGQTVYARAKPGIKLLVRRHIDTIYFCRIAESAVARTELVYFEKELLAENDPALRW